MNQVDEMVKNCWIKRSKSAASPGFLGWGGKCLFIGLPTLLFHFLLGFRPLYFEMIIFLKWPSLHLLRAPWATLAALKNWHSVEHFIIFDASKRPFPFTLIDLPTICASCLPWVSSSRATPFVQSQNLLGSVSIPDGVHLEVAGASFPACPPVVTPLEQLFIHDH